MAKEFATSPDEGAPCFRPWLNDPTVWKKIVTDSNAVAQEAGLGALSNFIEFGGQNAALKYIHICEVGLTALELDRLRFRG
jgi:protein STU2